jgi:hypothetical protein
LDDVWDAAALTAISTIQSLAGPDDCPACRIRPGSENRAMPLVRKSAVALGAIACLAYAASPALAASGPSTRLVRCDAGNCLLVSGYRKTAASEVRIGGHAVSVEGKRNWRARLPVETVRSWSAPFARTIEIAVHDAQKQSVSYDRADLPIGLMGHTDLASLVVGLN